MTRTLLTGAGGFVGAHTLEHLLTGTDWDIVAVDSFRHKGKTDRIAQILGAHPAWRSRVRVETHDLTAPVSEQMATRIGHCDHVIAMASASHVDTSIADPVAFITNNTSLVLSTLEYCRKTGPQSAVVVSTDEVYGPVPSATSPGHPEWAVILPSNPYAASKAAQEAIAVAYWRTYGVPLAITNTMNIIGERQDREKYLPKIIAAVRDGRTLTIHGEPGNIGSRRYLHARNMADALLFILRECPPAVYDRGATGRPDRYNIVSADQISNLELAQRTAAIMGRELKYQLEDFHTTRPGHDAHYGLDGGKLAAAGWKPPVPFTESLERTVRWTLDHPEWLLP